MVSWFWLPVWSFFCHCRGWKNRVLCPILIVKMQKMADFCGFAAIFGVFLVLKWCIVV